MTKKVIFLIILAIALCSLIPISKNFFTLFNKEKERYYTMLVLYDDTSNKDKKKEKKGFLLFYWNPKPYLMLFSINEQMSIIKNGIPTKIFSGSTRSIKKRLEKTYGYDIDYLAMPSTKKIKNLIKMLGGEMVFNLHSSTFKKGEVFIDKENYEPYLNGIKNILHKENAKKAFWYEVLDNYRKEAAIYVDYKKNLKKFYKHLEINVNYAHFYALIEPLLDEKIEIFFHSLQTNLEFFKIDKQQYLIPYKKGKYDQKRIKEKLVMFKEKKLEKLSFPIILQIRNTTKINRLAARTTGVLRLKHIDVLEYRNSSVPIKKSVLLDYGLSPTKREYLKKVTKIKKVYPAFDYQKKFDFSMYIAEDYYAIDLIKKKK